MMDLQEYDLDLAKRIGAHAAYQGSECSPWECCGLRKYVNVIVKLHGVEPSCIKDMMQSWLDGYMIEYESGGGR